MKPEYLLDTLREAETPFWVLYSKAQRGHGSNPRIYHVVPEDENDPGNIEESAATLKNVMARLAPGKYMLKYFRDKKQEKAGYFEAEFAVQDNTASSFQNASGIGSHGLYGAMPANIGQIVEERVQNALDKRRLEELEKENEQLRKSVEDPAGWKLALANAINGINENAPQVMPHLLSEAIGLIKGIFGPRVLAGPPIPEKNMPAHHQTQEEQMKGQDEKIEAITEEMQQNQEQYVNVLMRLRLLDEDLLITLTKMADKAEKNPALIAMLKTML